MKRDYAEFIEDAEKRKVEPKTHTQNRRVGHPHPAIRRKPLEMVRV